jgi:hypothetical protein
VYSLTHDSLSFKGKPSGNSQLTGESAQGSDECCLKNYCSTSTIFYVFVFAHTWEIHDDTIIEVDVSLCRLRVCCRSEKNYFNHTGANARSHDPKAICFFLIPVQTLEAMTKKIYVLSSFGPLCVELSAWSWLDSLLSSPLRCLDHSEPSPLSCRKRQSRFNTPC